MKNLFILAYILFMSISLNAQCPNGDFEENSLNGWRCWTGQNPLLNPGVLDLSTFTLGANPTRHLIVSSGNDPILGSVLPKVRDGLYSLRLGDQSVINPNINNLPAKAQIASYTFTVTYNFSFLYALVLQDPSHDPQKKENPFFSYWVSTSNDLMNSTSPSNLIVTKKFVSDASNPFFNSVPYNGVPLTYKDWQTECVPALNNYIGQTVTIYFATANCSEAGHFGYAYIDGLCKTNNPILDIVAPTTVCNVTDPIVVSGSSSWNEIDYYWKITETNVNGSVDVSGTEIVTPTVYNSPVGNINIKSVYNNGGKTIQNGKFYKVQLFARNCNGNWINKFVIIKATFPNLITSNNIVICCGSSTELSAQIDGGGYGGTNYPATKFMWYDESGQFIENGSMTSLYVGFQVYYKNKITVSPSKSTKYKVVFENNGCKNEKWIYVTTYINSDKVAARHGYRILWPTDYCSNPVNIQVATNYYYLNCNGTNDVTDFAYHDSMMKASIKILWSTGATTPSINGNVNSSYWVKVTTPCETDTAKFTIYHNTGAFPNLFIPTVCSSNTWWTVYQVLLQQGVSPAYNANSYNLKIYNRFGNLVWESQMDTHIGIRNGLISWPGTDMNYNQLDLGVYNYVLTFTNCSGSKKYTGNITLVH